MSYIYTIQKDALEALFIGYAEDIPANLYDSLKKEMLHLLITEEERITQPAFTYIATRYGLPATAWADYQSHIQIELSNKTSNFLGRVQQFDVRLQNFKNTAKNTLKDIQDLNQTRAAIQGA